MRVYIHLRNLGQSEEKIKCGLKPLTFSQKIISSDSQFSGCQSNLKGLQKEEGQGKDGILLPKQWVKKKSASQDVENGQQNEWAKDGNGQQNEGAKDGNGSGDL